MSGSRFTFTLFILAAITANPAFAAELRSLPLAPESVLAQLVFGGLQAAQVCENEQQPAPCLCFAPLLAEPAAFLASASSDRDACNQHLQGCDLASCTAARAP